MLDKADEIVIDDKSAFRVMRREPKGNWFFMGMECLSSESANRYLNDCRKGNRGGWWRIVQIRTTQTVIEETR